MTIDPHAESVSASEPSPRIRVLLVLTSTAGGAGLHAYYLARLLDRSRFDLTVAFGTGYPLDERFGALGIPVVRLHMSRTLNPVPNLRALGELFLLMRRGRFDIVCMGCSMAGFLGRIAAWAARAPWRVFILHAYASRPFQSRIKRTFYRALERLLDRLTDRYVAVSDATKRFGVASGIFGESKTLVIHNGIILRDKDRSPDAVRAELGLSAFRRIVGTVGRLETQKGIADFLEAAVLVREKYRDTGFVIVGDGPLREELESRARVLGLGKDVRFAGWRADVSRVLCGMDIFCLPSLWEQFPLSVLEAMVMERPVVATNVDGVPEAVVDGETGILVPPADPKALASAIITLFDKPELASRYGTAARARVEAHFTVEKMTRAYEEFWAMLYAEKSKRRTDA